MFKWFKSSRHNYQGVMFISKSMGYSVWWVQKAIKFNLWYLLWALEKQEKVSYLRSHSHKRNITKKTTKSQQNKIIFNITFNFQFSIFVVLFPTFYSSHPQRFMEVINQRKRNSSDVWIWLWWPTLYQLAVPFWQKTWATTRVWFCALLVYCWLVASLKC